MKHNCSRIINIGLANPLGKDFGGKEKLIFPQNSCRENSKNMFLGTILCQKKIHLY
jgi:hypothetical protein